MSRYAITERAGSFVATHRNTGVGTVLDLTERQGNTFQSLHDAGRIRMTLWLQRQHASSLGACLASAGGRARAYLVVTQRAPKAVQKALRAS